MRVAILLTGFSRTFEKVFFTIEELIRRYNADVYIATWDVSDNRLTKEIISSEVTRDIFKDVPNLMSCSIFDLEHYNKNKIPFIQNDRSDDVMVTDPRAIEHGTFWANRCRDQWYLVNEGFKSIISEYDIILRTRLDIAYKNIELYKSDELIIPADIGGWDFSDHLAFGNHTVMKKYCTFYKHMQDIYDKHNVDPTHAVNFLKFYISNYGTPSEHKIDNNITYKII
jgi:hypothetical protein